MPSINNNFMYNLGSEKIGATGEMEDSDEASTEAQN